ncbi:MAG: methylated-DNA--[protein]-cysteine S-methyltransferase [Bacteroidales bacterium]|nr:methylated-DNA--[protein]-cysteine S-methyltransferase [Bacteroidales bacterium]
MIYSKIIETPIGNMLACSVTGGICMLEFCDNRDLASEQIKLSEVFNAPIVEQSNEIIDLLETQLREYFEGKRKSFSVPIYPVGTDFQKKVWNQLLGVEYGKTITYKEQALALGDLKAIRAVASANGANKIPIVIPCHRVVGSQGNLTGYSGGLWRKKFLLDFESAQRQMKLL